MMMMKRSNMKKLMTMILIFFNFKNNFYNFLKYFKIFFWFLYFLGGEVEGGGWDVFSFFFNFKGGVWREEK